MVIMHIMIFINGISQYSDAAFFNENKDKI